MAFFLLLLVFLAALSRHLEPLDAQCALRINPLNAEARLAALTSSVNEGRLSPAIVAGIAEGMVLDPADARYFSLMGAVRLRQGNGDEAQSLFEQANRLSKTEIYALQNLLFHALSTKDYSRAVDYLDTLLRRWPSKFDELSSLLPALLGDEQAYPVVLERLRHQVPWRSKLILSLAGADDTNGLAYRLVLDLQRGGAPATNSEKAAVINNLIRVRAYDDAYRLFLVTMSDEDKKRSGYIYNSTFSIDQGGQVFAWTYRDTAAAEIKFSAAAPDNGAIVRFLNKPAKNIAFAQLLVLPSGSYRLQIDASAINLKAPRELFWLIRCIDPSREIARIAIEDGSYRNKIHDAEFKVEGCKAQVISLATGVVAESWRYSYSGQAIFHNVTIKGIGFGQTAG